MNGKRVILFKQSDYASLSPERKVAWNNWLKRQYRQTEAAVRRALKAWRSWFREATKVTWATWSCDRPIPDRIHNMITAARAWLQSKWSEWNGHHVVKYQRGGFYAR